MPQAAGHSLGEGGTRPPAWPPPAEASAAPYASSGNPLADSTSYGLYDSFCAVDSSIGITDSWDTKTYGDGVITGTAAADNVVNEPGNPHAHAGVKAGADSPQRQWIGDYDEWMVSPRSEQPGILGNPSPWDDSAATDVGFGAAAHDTDDSFSAHSASPFESDVDPVYPADYLGLSSDSGYSSESESGYSTTPSTTDHSVVGYETDLGGVDHSSNLKVERGVHLGFPGPALGHVLPPDLPPQDMFASHNLVRPPHHSYPTAVATNAPWHPSTHSGYNAQPPVFGGSSASFGPGVVAGMGRPAHRRVGSDAKVRRPPVRKAGTPPRQQQQQQEEEGTVDPENMCPFCFNSDSATGKTRQRRALKKRERKIPKLGRWWRQFGYTGPKYCQRCSEVVRDHLMRQKPNSAGCARDSPCDDCSKVIQHFGVPSNEVLWQRFDFQAQINKMKRDKKRQLPPSSGSLIGSDSKKSKKSSSILAGVAMGLALVALHTGLLYHRVSRASQQTERPPPPLPPVPTDDAAQCALWQPGNLSFAPGSAPQGSKGHMAHIPGRVGGVTWTDARGDFWLFGGLGYADSTVLDHFGQAVPNGHRQDLWRIKAKTSKAEPALFVAENIPVVSDTSAWPSARSYAISFVDDAHNMWMFGGMVISPNQGSLQDLWRFDGEWQPVARCNGGVAPSVESVESLCIKHGFVEQWQPFASTGEELMQAQPQVVSAGWPVQRGRGTISMHKSGKYGWLFGGSVVIPVNEEELLKPMRKIFTMDQPLADLWLVGDYAAASADGHGSPCENWAHASGGRQLSEKSGLSEKADIWRPSAEPCGGKSQFAAVLNNGTRLATVGAGNIFAANHTAGAPISGWMYQGPPDSLFIARAGTLAVAPIDGSTPQNDPNRQYFGGRAYNWPSARAGHAAWMDHVSGKLFIFGGVGTMSSDMTRGCVCAYLTDGWAWDGIGWLPTEESVLSKSPPITPLIGVSRLSTPFTALVSRTDSILIRELPLVATHQEQTCDQPGAVAENCAAALGGRGTVVDKLGNRSSLAPYVYRERGSQNQYLAPQSVPAMPVEGSEADDGLWLLEPSWGQVVKIRNTGTPPDWSSSKDWLVQKQPSCAAAASFDGPRTVAASDAHPFPLRADFMAWPTPKGGVLMFGGVDMRDLARPRPLEDAANLWLWESPRV